MTAARLETERQRLALVQPGPGAALPTGGCWWEAEQCLPLHPSPPFQQLGRLGAGKGRHGAHARPSLPPQPTHVPTIIFLGTRRFGRGEGPAEVGGAGSFVLRYQHPLFRSRPSPRLWLCSAPPHFLPPPRAAPPSPRARRGGGSASRGR